MTTQNITKEKIEAAQQQWGSGTVAIAAAHSAGENCEQVAREHVESLYA